MEHLHNNRHDINKKLERYGVTFGLYKNGVFKNQLFPFDTTPRIITKEEFEVIEKGLIQRASALNCFLEDIYTKRAILKDNIIPEDFIFSSPGYLEECCNITPPLGIHNHISGIDLVQAKTGEWLILEDNLRVPSGASYPLIARDIVRTISPETFEENNVWDNRDYAKLLKEMFDDVNCGGINVVLTPGEYNSAFFEHSYLAEKTNSMLAFPGDLFVEDDIVYYKCINGHKNRVGAIYHRISDEYMDPMVFNKDSLIGIPHVMEAYKKGNVALINAPGNGIADDKGIYYFVPKMIEYYLGEKPILNNAPTYVPYYEDDYDYILKNIKQLVIKDVSEAGGYGVVFGRDLTEEKLEELKSLIVENPRRFIAQEIIDFKDLKCYEDGEFVYRKADLRAFIIQGKDIKVWKSGLTRFARGEGSFVVNSSQGGGFKDTWIISQ
ncbi:MAG: circularly permuted type 2 ATP-grasp protein [Intestinibacter sp.]